MRALACLALVALVTASAASTAAAPPNSDSEQAKRLRFMEGSHDAVPKNSEPLNGPSPTDSDQQGAPSDVPEAPATPYKQWMSWLGSLQRMPAGGWRYLTSGGGLSQGIVVYFSTHHVMLEGNVVTAWLRWEYQVPQTQGLVTYRSAVTREVIDCARDAAKVVAETLYPDQNLGGTAGDSEVYSLRMLQWTPIIPGTLGDNVLSWACDKELKKGHQNRVR